MTVLHCGICAEYPFVKYNIQPNSYVYSQDEYTRLLDGMSYRLKYSVCAYTLYSFLQTKNGQRKKRTTCSNWYESMMGGSTLLGTVMIFQTDLLGALK